MLKGVALGGFCDEGRSQIVIVGLEPTTFGWSAGVLPLDDQARPWLLDMSVFWVNDLCIFWSQNLCMYCIIGSTGGRTLGQSSLRSYSTDPLHTYEDPRHLVREFNREIDVSCLTIELIVGGGIYS